MAYGNGNRSATMGQRRRPMRRGARGAGRRPASMTGGRLSGMRGGGRRRPAVVQRTGGGFKAAGDSLGSMNTSGARFVTHQMVHNVRSHKSRMTLSGINLPGKGHVRF